MSSINPNISATEVIPSVDTDIFTHNQNARFAVGIIAIGDDVREGRENEYAAYLKLRKNVYVDQTRMLSPQDLDAQGTERDIDDSRSVHFAIIENTMTNSRLVATMRVIIKSKEDSRPLPIEEFFPEVFEGPASEDSAEVSRYICRHEDRHTEQQLKWPLFTAVTSYLIASGLKPTYAVVEEFLEKSLLQQVPLERIAEPKFIPEYSAENLGIEIDIKKLAANMGLDSEKIEAIKARLHKFVYIGKLATEEPEPVAI